MILPRGKVAAGAGAGQAAIWRSHHMRGRLEPLHAMESGRGERAAPSSFPIRLVRPRRKNIVLSLMSFIFTILFLLPVLIVRNGHVALLWILVEIFWFCGLLFATSLCFYPPKLNVDADGFTETQLWMTRKWRWTEAANFRVWNLKGGSYILFNDLRPRNVQTCRRIFYKVFGFDGMLLAEWGAAAKSVADELSAARARWLSSR